MHDLKKLVKEVLEKGYLMSLGTVDKGGVWVADLIYVSDDELNIYWLSLPQARHSEAILKNPKVAAAVTPNDKEDVGIQLEGVAEKLDGDVLKIANAYNKKRGRPLSNKEGEIFKYPGQSWYRLRPKRIELIHDRLFGREKQVLEL
jgi:uncharacterized protein YhbP (UPF0306 family)